MVKRSSWMQAFICVGLALALGTVISYIFPAMSFVPIISLVLVYLFYGRQRKVSLLHLIAAYIVTYFLISIALLGALFRLAVMI